MHVVDAAVHYPDRSSMTKALIPSVMSVRGSQPGLTLEIAPPPYYVCPQGKPAANIIHSGVGRRSERWYKASKKDNSLLTSPYGLRYNCITDKFLPLPNPNLTHSG